MDYTKPPLSIREQIAKLKNRGLQIDDEQLAECYLSNISYYRLRAYTYPFQDNVNQESDHRFKKTIFIFPTSLTFIVLTVGYAR